MTSRSFAQAGLRERGRWHPVRPIFAVATLAILSFLAVTSDGATQVRPSIPEPACPRVALTLEPTSGARGMGLRIENTTPGDWPAHLRAEIVVEREVGGRWEPVSVAGLRLRATCDASTDRCVTLPVRGSLSIVPWTGMLGDAQCDCTRCAPAPAGRYRFVVNACDGCLPSPRTESPAFDLP